MSNGGVGQPGLSPDEQVLVNLELFATRVMLRFR
jgi:hypothetical protein